MNSSESENLKYDDQSANISAISTSTSIQKPEFTRIDLLKTLINTVVIFLNETANKLSSVFPDLSEYKVEMNLTRCTTKSKNKKVCHGLK